MREEACSTATNCSMLIYHIINILCCAINCVCIGPGFGVAMFIEYLKQQQKS